MIRNRTPRNRRGFSLIELLTVISILALLTAIFVGVLTAVRGDSNTRTTNDSMNKIQAAIDQQVKILADAAKKERRDKADTFTRLVPFCNNDEDRAEALLVLVKVRLQFPQTYVEAASSVSFPGVATAYPPPPAFRSASGSPTADQQAAVLLFLALSERTAAGDGVQTDQILQSDLSGTTNRVFRDAWGMHIAFVRFAQNAELNQPTFAPGAGVADPFDPRLKLAAAWSNKANAATVLGISFNGQNRVVTAVSAGKDKVFDTVANSLISDDIWGYRVRKQGAKTD